MTSRIKASDASQWSTATGEILGQATPASESADGTGPPNILYTIGHHPTLLPAFLGFTAALALEGVLARPDAELLALRAAWNCRSAFEWAHHVEYGLASGLSTEEILAIPDGPDHRIWSEHQSLLLQTADELHATRGLADGHFASLRERWSEAEIVEIVFVVGNYTMLSMVANATGVPVEQRLDAPPYRMPSAATTIR